MPLVYLSIGSNLGDRKKYIRAALKELENLGQSVRCSHPYRTKPYGFISQPDFINMACVITTELSPEVLLTALQSIENRLERVHALHWGPRTIDLDIVFYDCLVLQTDSLTIPHQDMQNRGFVLKPLMDLCPDFVHPVLEKTVRELFEDWINISRIKTD